MGMIKIPNNAAVLQALLNSANNNTCSFCGFGNCIPSLSTHGYSFMANLTNASYLANGFSLYKGALPTQTELDAISGSAAITTVAALPRYADLLSIHYVQEAKFVLNNLQVTLNNAVAAASGQASWFMLFSVYNGAGSMNQALVGTVSETGGGGDIELLTTSLIAGAMYKIPQIQIAFPSKFTW